MSELKLELETSQRCATCGRHRELPEVARLILTAGSRAVLSAEERCGPRCADRRVVVEVRVRQAK